MGQLCERCIGKTESSISAEIYKVPPTRSSELARNLSDEVKKVESTEEDTSPVREVPSSRKGQLLISEKSSPLVNSVNDTLSALRRATRHIVTSDEDEEDFEGLDDEELALKSPPPPPDKEEMTGSRRISRIGSLLSGDLEKAYFLATSKHSAEKELSEDLQKSEKKPKLIYDEEQASLIGAVLGIGERKKDDSSHTELDEEQEGPPTLERSSTHTRIGTLAGLGDVTDDEADLRYTNLQTIDSAKGEHTESEESNSSNTASDDSNKNEEKNVEDNSSSTKEALEKPDEEKSTLENDESQKPNEKEEKENKALNGSGSGAFVGSFRKLRQKLFLGKNDS